MDHLGVWSHVLENGQDHVVNLDGDDLLNEIGEWAGQNPWPWSDFEDAGKPFDRADNLPNHGLRNKKVLAKRFVWPHSVFCQRSF